MKSHPSFLAVALLLVCVASSISAQTCAQLNGTWQNELGSQLVISKITADYQILGEYRSSSGVDGKVFPLTGWVNNYQQNVESPVSIAFSVRWEGYKSITSWTGTCDEDEKGVHIKTLWHFVRPETEQPWERIIANSSTFRPTK